MGKTPFLVNPFDIFSRKVDAEVLRLKEMHRQRVSESSDSREGVLIMISKLILMTELLSDCVFSGDRAMMESCTALGREFNDEEHILTTRLVQSGVSGSMIRGVIRFPYRLERIGDMLEAILASCRSRADLGISFTAAARDELRQSLAVLLNLMNGLREAFLAPTKDLLDAMKDRCEKLTRFVDDARSAHWQRLEEGACSPSESSLYREILDSINWSNDYLLKIVASPEELSAAEEKLARPGPQAFAA